MLRDLALPVLLLAASGTLAAAATATTHHAVPAHSRPSHPEGPKALGHFEDWTAATHLEAGQTVCYAFVRAASGSQPGARSNVVLTVTERSAGRDAVAISAGSAYPANAAVTVEVDPTRLDFYTAGHSAFARDGRAAVAAFSHGRQAVAHSPGPRNATVTDTFSLRGFAAAYAAINRACPAR